MEILMMKKTFFELPADVLNQISGGKDKGKDGKKPPPPPPPPPPDRPIGYVPWFD